MGEPAAMKIFYEGNSLPHLGIHCPLYAFLVGCLFSWGIYITSWLFSFVLVLILFLGVLQYWCYSHGHIQPWYIYVPFLMLVGNCPFGHWIFLVELSYFVRVMVLSWCVDACKFLYIFVHIFAFFNAHYFVMLFDGCLMFQGIHPGIFRTDLLLFPAMWQKILLRLIYSCGWYWVPHFLLKELYYIFFLAYFVDAVCLVLYFVWCLHINGPHSIAVISCSLQNLCSTFIDYCQGIFCEVFSHTRTK